jgi:hypothetical protein
MYPISLKRTAWLSKLEYEERIALDNAQVAYEEERKRVDEEWRKGRDRLREQMLEGIEERRRRAREEKEGEGTVGGITNSSIFLLRSTFSHPLPQMAHWTHSPAVISRVSCAINLAHHHRLRLPVMEVWEAFTLMAA